MSVLENVLGRLGNVRQEDGGHKASCPCPDHGRGNGDRNPSLSVGADSEGNVLLKCFAGCPTEDVVSAIGLKMSDLFECRNGLRGGGSYSSPQQRSTGQPATFVNYAAYVELPESFLKSLGLREYRHLGEPAVSMPYLDGSGEEVLLTRSRVSLTGSPKVKTRKGDKHSLYGLWKLEEAREAGYAWAVEGESDSQTLWYHKEPAVGIPGANGWKAEWASDLDGVGKIYVVVEDEAGEALWRKLVATAELRERLYRVELEGAQDVSELHKQDRGSFRERLREAREGAVAWLDIAETEEEERGREAWAKCQELAESEDILAEFIADLERCRMVGERTNAKLLYLAMVSRLLDRIVSVAVKGPSSGGKSYLVNLVSSFFPESASVKLTAFSEKTLFYTEETLARRHIILSEASGLGDFQEYVIRTLLSEGFLEYEFVEKTSEGLRARRIRKDGPTGFITTTTRDKLHAENETRYLSLTVTDTREQTRRVFRALAEERVEEPDRRRWLALQAWLEGVERRVTIPYAGALAEKMGDVAVRLRRDFSVVLSLIRAHALLHQATREKDAEGRVVASLIDYARVRDLVSGLISEGVEATVPATVRETVDAVEKLIRDSDEEWTTNKAVAEDLNVDKAAASRRVRTAINRGYLKNLEESKGRPARLVIGEEMPEDREILPAPEDLGGSGCAVDRDSGEIEHPPPPSSANGMTRFGRGGSYAPPENRSTDQPFDGDSDEREEFVL